MNGGIPILRHPFCSMLAMRGASMKSIQDLAGHQSLTTTQRYMHLSPAEKNAAIRLLNRRPNWRRGWRRQVMPPTTLVRTASY